MFWYEINSLVPNPDKFQLIFPGTNDANLTIKIGSFELNSSKMVKLLGVIIDGQRAFILMYKISVKRYPLKLKSY